MVPSEQVPKQDSQEEVPKQGSQEEVPKQGSKEQVTKGEKVPKGSQEEVPKQGSQEEVPKQGSQEQVPKNRQDSQARFAGVGSQRFPVPSRILTECCQETCFLSTVLKQIVELDPKQGLQEQVPKDSQEEVLSKVPERIKHLCVLSSRPLRHVLLALLEASANHATLCATKEVVILCDCQTAIDVVVLCKTGGWPLFARHLQSCFDELQHVFVTVSVVWVPAHDRVKESWIPHPVAGAANSRACNHLADVAARSHAASPARNSLRQRWHRPSSS